MPQISRSGWSEDELREIDVGKDEAEMIETIDPRRNNGEDEMKTKPNKEELQAIENNANFKAVDQKLQFFSL